MKKKQTEFSAENLSEMKSLVLRDAELLDPFIAAFLESWDPTKSLSPEDRESTDVVLDAIAAAKQALEAATREATTVGKPVSNAVLRRTLRPVVAALKNIGPNISVEQKRTRIGFAQRESKNENIAAGSNSPVTACTRFLRVSETLFKWSRAKKVDNAFQREIGSPGSRDTEDMRHSETILPESETAPSIETVIEHAHIHGISTLRLNDIRVMKEYVLNREATLVKQEITKRFNEACKVIDDLQPGEKVTAKRLTKFFAKKHEAAKTHLKRTEGEVLPDEKKRELVELVDAFRATGGIVQFAGRPCTMSLNKTKSMSQHRFMVRSVDTSQSSLWANIKVPSLTFSKT